MKTFAKHLLIVIGSMVIGGVLGWQAFSYRIRLRIIPFDREQYHASWHFDFWRYEPTIDFHFSPERNTFGLSENPGRYPEEDLDNHLARFASISTSLWVIVSFNRDATIQQVRDVGARISKYGFSEVKMLIEDNRNDWAENEKRLFSAVKISPSKDFDWHQVEWEIDAQQEEAAKRMKRKGTE